MTVHVEGGLTDGELARILHAGLRHQYRTVSGTDEITHPSVAEAGDTVDRWRPRLNELAAPDDLSDAAWVKTNVTVLADGQTVRDDTSTGTHEVTQGITLTASNYVFSVLVERVTVPKLRLRFTDGAGTLSATTWSMEDGSFAATTGPGVWAMVDLGGGRYEVRADIGGVASGSGSINIRLHDGTGTSYAGTGREVRIKRVRAHNRTADMDVELHGPQAVSCCCIAGHNIGSRAGQVLLRYSLDGGSTYSQMATVTPPDDSPIMVLFPVQTAQHWSVRIVAAGEPEAAVVWLGNPLVMPTMMYGGLSPARMVRATDVVGNISGSGQLLGRSRLRSVLRSRYGWEHLPYSWVRAYLDGPRGLIQSMEVDPIFLAWRPGLTGDVDYIMRAQSGEPRAMGIADLWTYGLEGEALAYE